jgi:hypothetical protein
MRSSGAVVAAILALALGACGGGGSSHRDTNASAPQADKCLRDAGAKVTGDPDHRPPGGDPGLERELVASVKGAGAFIAFYDTEAHAKASEPGVRKSADKFGGLVVRDQNTTIAYTNEPSGDVRKRVEDCLF